MKTRLLRALARLASESYQLAYIVHANVDEYVLPEDLLEDAASLSELVAREQYSDSFTEEQRSALLHLRDAIRREGKLLLTDVSPEELVTGSQEWLALRRLAKQVLSMFGVSLDGIAAEDIDEAFGSEE